MKKRIIGTFPKNAVPLESSLQDSIICKKIIVPNIGIYIVCSRLKVSDSLYSVV